MLSNWTTKGKIIKEYGIDTCRKKQIRYGRIIGRDRHISLSHFLCLRVGFGVQDYSRERRQGLDAKGWQKY